ncbi:hypothetical protein [Streptomyces lunaelactis]|uniref:hypothetical protein n=1 Tax=Streptomyces lunaelactis TaxID=1535768 RepID=UPI0020C83106|nr:hypothetical protein [Streptomyces lunaelactis]
MTVRITVTTLVGTADEPRGSPNRWLCPARNPDQAGMGRMSPAGTGSPLPGNALRWNRPK